MNIAQLRKSLKIKWLTYYRENREWLVRLGVWVNCDGQRRPSSSFILATLSILEPRLTQIFPLVVELSNNPDRVVAALGLNFNPDVELKAMTGKSPVTEVALPDAVKLLPASDVTEIKLNPDSKASNITSFVDENCRGTRDSPD